MFVLLPQLISTTFDSISERTHSWHNKFRRLIVRWERKAAHYAAMVQLASVLIIYRLVITA